MSDEDRYQQLPFRDCKPEAPLRSTKSDVLIGMEASRSVIHFLKALAGKRVPRAEQAAPLQPKVID